MGTFYMPFMFEFEDRLSKSRVTDVMKLAQQAGQAIGWTDQAVQDLSDCYTQPMGNKFQHEIATLTAALSPPHQYVPWIVVNGEHTDAIQQSCQTNVLDCVCKEYTGSSKLCDDVNNGIVAEPDHVTGHTNRDLPNMIKRFPSVSQQTPPQMSD